MNKDLHDDPTSITRLNKYLAFHLGLSRRQADEYIQQGRIKINSKTATLGARLQQGDMIELDNKQIEQKDNFTYLLLHKPVGYVCSRKRQGDTPTIYSLLPAQYRDLKPVGRLDADSSGLLIMSDDGDFTFKMTHPKFYKTKVYQVNLNTPLQPLHQQMISDYGIMLDDGKSKFLIERGDYYYTITMSEGRNRQIRRTFAALGYKVTKLHRTRFGEYTLDDLESGKYKMFSHHR